MRTWKEVVRAPNLITGYLYFYVHFVVEVLCFYVLSSLVGDSFLLWFAPLFYDALAFVPQSLFGYLEDRYPKLNLGLLGIFLLLLGFITYFFAVFSTIYYSLFLICIGNALLHVEGAEVTLRCSDGRLAHSAIFVGGGSFGVITGKLLLKSKFVVYLLIFLGLSTIPFIILAHLYKKETLSNVNPCAGYQHALFSEKKEVIILFAFLIVVVRGFMGYGLPTSWNKTIIQNILFYCSMGVGKIAGGYLADRYGVRRVGIMSSLLAIPFLLFGDHIMIISLIGVAFFSMTMSLTLGILVSVLKEKPGLAFGLTTIGLFLGTVPIFFFRISSFLWNGIMIVFLSLLCVFLFKRISAEVEHE